MPFQAPRDAAVIDIGSNSVRLVVYRLEGRAIWTVFNEKVLAGLGRDLAKTGRLAPDGVIQTLQALKRFRAVLEAVNPAETFAVATAAARDAQDGPDFIARVKAETGFSVRVLTGEEEAHYAAVGVLAGAPDATGVVGDLGGASLELIRLNATGAGQGVTLPLGPFSLSSPQNGAQGGFDGERVRRLARERIAAVAADFRTDTFHAVGGAWRNLALLHMRLSGYPLHVVHQYEIPAAEALEAARLVAHQSKSSLERIEGMSKKRSETLPYAAVVLETLIEQLQLKRIEISAFGVREGLLFEAMPPRVRGLDPLIEGCTALGARQGVADDLGVALDAWITPAFRTLPPLFGERDNILVSAACRLSDVGARLHPDHRADLVFEQVLRAPIAGQTPCRTLLPGRGRPCPPRHDLQPAGTADPGAPAGPRPAEAGPSPGRDDAPGLRPLGPQPQPAGPLAPDPGQEPPDPGRRARLRRPPPGRTDQQARQYCRATS